MDLQDENCESKAEELLASADEALNTGDAETALGLYQRVAKEYPEEVENWWINARIGHALIDLGKKEEALPYLEEAYREIGRQEDPVNNFVLLVDLLLACYKTERYESALRYGHAGEQYLAFPAILQREGDVYLYHLTYGRACVETRNYPTAIEQLSRALTTKEQSNEPDKTFFESTVSLELARVYLFIDSLEEAKKYLDRIDYDSLGDGHKKTWHGTWMLYLVKTEQNEAVLQMYERFKQVGVRDWEAGNAAYNAAVAHWELGNFDMAHDLLREALGHPMRPQYREAAQDLLTQLLGGQ